MAVVGSAFHTDQKQESLRGKKEESEVRLSL